MNNVSLYENCIFLKNLNENGYITPDILVTPEQIQQLSEHCNLLSESMDLDYILQESDLSISFYIKDDSENNIETLKYNITNELEYLRDYDNIEIVKVYGYVGQLDIKHKEIEFPDEHKDYGNSSDDYYDGYKFGCYYIDATSNNLTSSLSMDLNRGYTAEKGESINGWKYRVLN